MNFEKDCTYGLYRPVQETHMLGVVKPVGKDVARAEDEFNHHRKLGHVDDNDRIETDADYTTTLASIISKLRTGNYSHIKVFGGDGTLNVVTNAVKHIAERLTADQGAASVPAIIAGDFGTVGDGRKSTHGRRFLNDLDINNHPIVPFYPMELEVWEGKTLLWARAVALYCGIAYTARVAETADSDKWRRRVNMAPYLGSLWSKPVQGQMALSQLGGTPRISIFDRETDERVQLYDLSLINGNRLGGMDVGIGDLRSPSFMETRAHTKAAIVGQAGRLAVRNFGHLPVRLQKAQEKDTVEYCLVDIEGADDIGVHFDGQPERMRKGWRFICRSSGVSLPLVAPALAEVA